MTLNEYQKAAQRTSNTHMSSTKIENALLGLAGEVGELADHYKKYAFQGHEYNAQHMMREAGDVLWYLAELASGLGIPLDIIAEANIAKLKARYPDGFDPDKSMHRKAGDD